MILVGNKVDLEDQREITIEQGQSMASECSCSFIESSAKTAINIEQIFQDIIKLIIYLNIPEVTPAKKGRNGCNLY